MAQKVNVQLVDDLDGSTAESTVEFGLDGVHYAIDLGGFSWWKHVLRGVR